MTRLASLDDFDVTEAGPKPPMSPAGSPGDPDRSGDRGPTSCQDRGRALRPWPLRFSTGHRSSLVLAVFIALLALVYGFYRTEPSAMPARPTHARHPGRLAGRPTTTTTGAQSRTTSAATSTTNSAPVVTTTAPSVTPAVTVPATTTTTTFTPPASTPAVAVGPTPSPAASGPLALSASSSPAYDGSNIQVTVTAELTRGGSGYAGQTVSYSGPGCTSATATTASNGTAMAVLTCTPATTIPITVAVDGKSVVTTVEA